MLKFFSESYALITSKPAVFQKLLSKGLSYIPEMTGRTWETAHGIAGPFRPQAYLSIYERVAASPSRCLAVSSSKLLAFGGNMHENYDGGNVAHEKNNILG